MSKKCTLGARFLGNMLAGKGAVAMRRGKNVGVNLIGYGIARAGNGIILPHPLNDVEIQKYCHNEPKFKDVY